MNVIQKYWLFIFFIANILAQYILLKSINEFLFYPSLCFGIIFILKDSRNVFRIEMINKYKIFYIYVFMILVYQFTFGMNHIHEKTWTYIISKVIFLITTIIIVNKYDTYYKNNFYKSVCYVLITLLAIGFFIGGSSSMGRMNFGFSNPNTSGGIASIALGWIIITNGIKNKTLKIGVILYLLYVILLSGSRASLGMAIFAVIFKYGLSNKLLFSGCILSIIVLWVLPEMNISFIGLDRLISTLKDNDFSEGREVVREAAWLMIQEHPIDGNGIYTPNSEIALMLTELGSHNAYLDFLKWYGYPIGGLLIISFIWGGITLIKRFWNSKDLMFKFHLYIVIGILIKCMFEGLIWGVNEIENTLFFTSFAVLDKFRNSKQIN